MNYSGGMEETPFQTPPTSVPIPPALTFVPPKPKTSILPIIFGFLIVVILAAVFGVVYYKNKLTVSSSPMPTSSAIPLASAEPEASVEPSSSSSASPKSSVKPTTKPVTLIKTTTSPTPTPVPQPTLDIRFGNPSVNVKQTYDDGSGAGRVINREYTSVQSGQFDEVPASWSPRITTCFHIVANEEIKGSDLKFTFTLDDKVEVEDSLAQYDKLEAGRLYDWCRDTISSIGKHTAKLLINPSKSLKESGYTNDLARVDWENLADIIAPNFTLMGPNDEGDSGTCLFPQYVSDNVTAYANLKIEQKVDDAGWTKFEGSRYCFKGTSGSTHSYASRITDERGNAHEQKKTFVLY
jgi:hypothetical protein